MTSYEFTGKSVKEAISKAGQELNIAEDKLEIEVLEESTRGFLGIVGQRDARIRVRLKEAVKEQTAFQPPSVTLDQETGAPEPPSEDVPERDAPLESEAERAIAPVTPEQSAVLEHARTFLKGLLQRIPVEVQVEASVSGDAIALNIIGDGSGLLIGKRGQTLDALQFVMNKIINRNCPLGSKTEVIVDTEHYRRRKMEILRETALRMSDKAKKTLRPVSLSPMPPSERRIIHLILAEEDSEVYTKSYGEGTLRRIIIYPRRGVTNKRRRR